MKIMITPSFGDFAIGQIYYMYVDVASLTTWAILVEVVGMPKGGMVEVSPVAGDHTCAWIPLTRLWSVEPSSR